MIKCRLHTSLLYRVVGMLVPLMIAIAMIVIGVLMVSGLIQIQTEPGVGWLVLIVGAFATYVACSFLRFPQTIELHDDGELVFRGLGKPKTISARDIRSIEPAQNLLGMLVVEHSGGKQPFLNQFTDFHNLLSALKTLNPNIEFKGC